MKDSKLRYFTLISVFLLAGIFFFKSAKTVLAAPFTRATIRYDRMKATTNTSIHVTIIPATVGTEGKLKLIFGSAVLGAGTSATTGGLGVGETGMLGALTPSKVGTSEFDLVIGDLAVGSTYSVNLTVGISTPAAGTTTDIVSTTTSGDGVIDQTKIASKYITDDQVVITANVPPTFTFVMTGNTDVFTGDLSSSSVVSTQGIGVSVATNAARGWTGWVKSVGASLTSATTSESIGTSQVYGSVGTCVAGVDCYVLDVGVTSGTGAGSLTADPAYAGNGTSSGGGLSTSLVPFASRTGKTNGDTVWLRAHVTMIATKAAASDYTDTWTVIGAGNF